MSIDVDTSCAELAEMLGLDSPVSEKVLHAALADPTYAHNLLTVRGHDVLLAHLLANPPRPSPEGGPSTAALARTAAGSLARWARTGFTTVPDETFERRLAACFACPHRTVPPDGQRTAYRVAGAALDEAGVCGRCGCVIRVKARRASDGCPDPHPDDPSMTRWGEPPPLASAGSGMQ